MTEEEAGGIDWERFATDKLYRALATERGLPPPLPAGHRIDWRRYWGGFDLDVDLAYRTMIDTRGRLRTPEEEARTLRIVEEKWRKRGYKWPEDFCEGGSEKVVCISDPRFRVRCPSALAALRR